MKRFFQLLAITVGVWLLASFLGVMFDSARANLWTQSLMWAMLASVILAPVLLFAGTSSENTPARPEAERPFEIDENANLNQEDAHEEEEWPYTSEHSETNPGGSSTVN